MSAENGFIKCTQCRSDLGVKGILFNKLANARVREQIIEKNAGTIGPEVSVTTNDFLFFMPAQTSFKDLLDKLSIDNYCCRASALGAVERCT